MSASRGTACASCRWPRPSINRPAVALTRVAPGLTRVAPGLTLVAAALTLAAPARAQPAEPWVIPPGREAVVVDLVQRALARAGAGGTFEASIDRTVVLVRVPGSDGADRELVISRPEAPPPARARTLAPGVFLRCQPACAEASDPRWTRMGRALAVARDEVADALWVTNAEALPVRPVERRRAGGKTARALRRILSSLVFAYVVCWALFTVVGRLRSRPRGVFERRRWLLVGGALAAFCAVALTAAPMLPLHDHDSFVLRSDCAWRPDCDSDPAGPAWSPPTFHAYHLLLGVLPHRLWSLGALSLALSALALLLFYVFVRKLLRRMGRDAEGRVVAPLALCFAAFHPVFIRVSVAATFWPYTLTCVFGAGVACLLAIERRRATDAVAAALLLCMAALSNLVCLTLLPLLLIAPLAWRRRASLRPVKGVVVAWLAAAAFAVPTLAAAVSELGAGPSVATAFLARDPLWTLGTTLRNLLYFTPELTPWPLAVFLVVGVSLLASRRRLRILSPALLPLVLMEPVLGTVNATWSSGYPSRLLDAYPTSVFLALLAAMGAFAVARAVASGVHGSRARAWISVALALLPLSFLPASSEALTFLRVEGVLSRELRALSLAFERLPPHALLVIPPRVLPPLPGAGRRGDPIEASFPLGEYRDVMRHRGLPVSRVQALDSFLRHPLAVRGAVLLYLGATLRSFQPHEIRGGRVPDTLERPLLARLRARYDLAPEVTFPLSARQPEAAGLRLGADRRPALTLGFFRLTERRRPP